MLFGLLVVLFCGGLYSQQKNINSAVIPPDGEGGTAAPLVANIPNLSPLSPNAYQFTKYGEIQVNESTGAISPSIPLFTYVAGDIQIPITLSYSGNGVKVAQDPTWVGINWNLSPGGVITRQVRDQPDEKATNKQFHTLSDVLNLKINGELSTDTSTDYFKRLELIATGGSSVDSEVDIFNFNFPGYSGSFYLDELGKAHLIRHDKKLKIITTGLSSDLNNVSGEIIIITPEGNSFVFGGATASESSKTGVVAGAGSNALSHHVQNAFYLKEINLYKGGNIYFDYVQLVTDVEGLEVPIDAKETISKYLNSDIGGCGEKSKVGVYKKNSMFINYKSKIVLSKIYASGLNTDYVEFNSFNYGSFSSKRLKNVFLKNKSGAVLKKYVLQYKTLVNENSVLNLSGYDNKYFLEQVDFYDVVKNVAKKLHDYKMKYKNLDQFPIRNSKGRDKNGYYNGKANPTLLPYHSRFQENIGLLANREVDTTYIKYGVLEKIIYPTKGYTTFEYESPIQKIEPKKDSISLRVYENEPYYQEDKGSDIYPDGHTADIGLLLNAGTTITFDIDLTKIGFFKDPDQIVLKMNKGGVETIIWDYDFSGSNYPTTISQNITSTGNYNFYLNLFGEFNSNESVDVKVKVKYESIDEKTNTYYPSIRIKKVRSYTKEGAQPLTKRYYYNTKENIGEETLYLLRDLNYISETTIRQGCGVGVHSNDDYIHLSTNPLNNMFRDDSGKILYKNTTVSYGGDEFENGGKESKFKVDPSASPITISDVNNSVYNSSYGSNRSFANSTLEKEEFFSYKKADPEPFTVLKTTEYLYQNTDGETHTMHNIMSETLSSGNGSRDIEDYNFGFYETSSRKYLLRKVTSYNFPKNEAAIETIKDYEYESFVGQPTSIKTKDSRGNVSENKLYYPDQVETHAHYFEPSEKTTISSMVTANKPRIHEPYLSESYYNDTLVSSQLTTYNTISLQRTLPSMIKTLKGVYDSNNNVFQERISFIKYNTSGFLAEVSKANGTGVKYVYNFENQVTQKIENYDKDNFTVNDGDSSLDLCFYQKAYPNNMVTTYNYDPENKSLLISIVDPKCNITYFVYDDLNRLLYVKDSEGKVLSKNEYNYKN